MQVATSWAKAEVPDRFKNWKIFQDGNRVREGIRKGYIGVLRQVDKVREPYPEWKHVKKKWFYEPDLRKQYVLPRVLRLPAIMQETPIPHLKPFVKAVQGADDELGLKAVARTHVPAISSEFGKDGAKTPTKPDEPAPPTKQIDPPRSQRYQRRPRYSRKPSFNDFRPRHQNRYPTPPKTPVPEIDSDDGLQNGAPDSSRAIPSINEAASRAKSPLHSADQQAKPAEPVDSLHSVLVEMSDKFERIKKFKDEQIKKAAYRYVGHPENPMTPAVNANQDVLAEGAGLAPIRIKKEASHELSPDPTPRRVDDPTAMDADVSNPHTPNAPIYHFSEAFTPDTPYGHTSPLRSPHLDTSDPSPILSPVGTWTPKSGLLTPGSQRDSQVHTPNSFRLPAEYVDILHEVRMRQDLQHLHRNTQVPFMAQEHRIEPAPRQSIGVGWEAGRPSEESIRRVQEMAKLNDADYAIYSDEPAPERSGRIQFAKVHPSDDEDIHDSQASSGQIKAPDTTLVANADGQSTRRDKNLMSTAQGKQKPIFDLSSFTASAPRSRIESNPRPATIDSSEVRRAQDRNNADITHANELSPFDTPPRKRKRPVRLDESDQTNFNFPAPKPEFPSPRLKGFKPSLTIKEAPNADPDSSIYPDKSPGVIFNRERMRRLLHSSSQHLRSFQETLRNLSPKASRERVIQAYKELREHPPERQGDTVLRSDARPMR